MVRVGIVGISGYSGLTLLKILLNHPDVRLNYVSANTTTGFLSDIWPQFRERTPLFCESFDADKAAELCDVVFLAVPHTVSMEITPGLLERKIRVIDLSGDYRLKSSAIYKKWYGKTHADARRLGKAVYGLPEIYKAAIARANLIANPGCYPTAALLALAPLASLKDQSIRSIIIDAKSGVSGAGKKISGALMFSEVNESLKAYKVFAHQHTPEIEQYLSSMAQRDMRIIFTPHLIPMTIGIYETIYVEFHNGGAPAGLHALYTKFYKTEPFVRILPKDTLPEIKHVAGSNFCDIGISYDRGRNITIITAAIDNLVKGAAGQAVQNMNLMFGHPETTGLY